MSWVEVMGCHGYGYGLAIPDPPKTCIGVAELVRATVVGRGAERDAERNAVLAGDPKCLVYYVMID